MITKQKCVYKAIFQKDNIIESYKDNPFWIVSHTGKFDGKLHSRGKYINTFIKEYGPQNIRIEFISYVNSEKEFQMIISQYKGNKFCMNNLYKKNYGNPGVKKGPLSKEKKDQFIQKYKKTKQTKKALLDNNKGKSILYQKKYYDFNEFYDLVQSFTNKKGYKFNLNWDNNIIKDKFLQFFKNTSKTNKKEIENLCRFSSFSPATIAYWTDRGWDKNYAMQKISFLNGGRSPCSKESLEIFSEFYLEYKDIFKCYIHENFDLNSKEFRLYDNANRKLYCYDFTIKDLNLIFEYQGEAFHPNPSWSKDKWNDWRSPFTKINADEFQLLYNKKVSIALQKGFTLVQLWSSDTIELNKSKIKKAIDQSIAFLQKT